MSAIDGYDRDIIVLALLELDRLGFADAAADVFKRVRHALPQLHTAVDIPNARHIAQADWAALKSALSSQLHIPTAPLRYIIQDIARRRGTDESADESVFDVSSSAIVPAFRIRPMRAPSSFADAFTSSSHRRRLFAARIRPLCESVGHLHVVDCVVLAADATVVATASYTLVKTWSLTTGELLQTYRGCLAEVNDIAFSADAAILAAASEDKTLRVWNARTAAAIVVVSITHAVYRLRFHPHRSSHRLFAAAFDGAVHVVDIAPTGDIQHIKYRTEHAPYELADHLLEHMSPCTYSELEYAAEHSTSDALPILPAASRATVEYEDRGAPVQILCVCLSSDGALLFFGANDGVIRVVDVTTHRLLTRLIGHRGEVDSVQLVSNDRRILSLDNTGALLLWERVTTDARVVHFVIISRLSLTNTNTTTAPPATVAVIHRSIASSDDALVFAAASDFSLRVWRLPVESVESRADIIAHRQRQGDGAKREGKVRRADDVTTASSSRAAAQREFNFALPSTVRAHSLCADVVPFRSFIGIHNAEIAVLCAHSTLAELCVTAGADGRIVVWDVVDGVILRCFLHAPIANGHGHPLSFVDGAIAADGTMIVLSTDCGRIIIYGISSAAKYKLTAREQFHAIDYSPITVGADDFVVDSLSELPPNMAPNAHVLINANGDIYTPQPQRIVSHENAFASDAELCNVLRHVRAQYNDVDDDDKRYDVTQLCANVTFQIDQDATPQGLPRLEHQAVTVVGADGDGSMDVDFTDLTEHIDADDDDDDDENDDDWISGMTDLDDDDDDGADGEFVLTRVRHSQRPRRRQRSTPPAPLSPDASRSEQSATPPKRQNGRKRQRRGTNNDGDNTAVDEAVIPAAATDDRLYSRWYTSASHPQCGDLLYYFRRGHVDSVPSPITAPPVPRTLVPTTEVSAPLIEVLLCRVVMMHYMFKAEQPMLQPAELAEDEYQSALALNPAAVPETSASQSSTFVSSITTRSSSSLAATSSPPRPTRQRRSVQRFNSADDDEGHTKMTSRSRVVTVDSPTAENRTIVTLAPINGDAPSHDAGASVVSARILLKPIFDDIADAGGDGRGSRGEKAFVIVDSTSRRIILQRRHLLSSSVGVSGIRRQWTVDPFRVDYSPDESTAADFIVDADRVDRSLNRQLTVGALVAVYYHDESAYYVGRVVERFNNTAVSDDAQQRMTRRKAISVKNESSADEFLPIRDPLKRAAVLTSFNSVAVRWLSADEARGELSINNKFAAADPATEADRLQRSINAALMSAEAQPAADVLSVGEQTEAVSYLSPWEVEPLQPTVNVAMSAAQSAFDSGALRSVVAAVMTEPEFTEFAAPVSVPLNPMYQRVVPYPSDLSTVLERMDRGFYRSFNAIAFDVNAIVVAATRFHRANAPAIRKAKRIRQRIFAQIQLQTRTDERAMALALELPVFKRYCNGQTRGSDDSDNDGSASSRH